MFHRVIPTLSRASDYGGNLKPPTSVLPQRRRTDGPVVSVRAPRFVARRTGCVVEGAVPSAPPRRADRDRRRSPGQWTGAEDRRPPPSGGGRYRDPATSRNSAFDRLTSPAARARRSRSAPAPTLIKLERNTNRPIAGRGLGLMASRDRRTPGDPAELRQRKQNSPAAVPSSPAPGGPANTWSSSASTIRPADDGPERRGAKCTAAPGCSRPRKPVLGRRT